MSKCRKFTGKYEGFTTKISKFIVQETSNVLFTLKTAWTILKK